MFSIKFNEFNNNKAYILRLYLSYDTKINLKSCFGREMLRFMGINT